MKLSFTLILAALVVPKADAIFNRLVNRFLDTACSQLEVALGLDQVATCDCKGSLKLGSGVKGNVNCTLTKVTCLLPPFYCAKGNFGAGIQVSLLQGAGITSDITGCFKLESGFPPPLTNFGNIDQLCIVIKPKGLKFDTCSVTLGAEKCNSCEICASGTEFKFNCTNVDLNGATTPPVIPGPALTTCIGLDLAPPPRRSVFKTISRF